MTVYCDYYMSNMKPKFYYKLSELIEVSLAVKNSFNSLLMKVSNNRKIMHAALILAHSEFPGR